MTHAEMTQRTKLALAAALKEQMNKKPLNKITVKDLITTCNVDRKTFYYHFSDIYDLLKWMLEEEAIHVLEQFDLITDFQDAAIFILNYIEENYHLLKCAYDAVGRDELKRFLFHDFEEIVKNVIIQFEQDLDLSVSPSYERFLVHFYVEATTGIMIEWLQNPKRMSKEDAVRYADTVLFSTMPAALKAGTKMK